MALSAIIIVLSVLLDQISKIIAQKYLLHVSEITAIPGILGFSYVENKGAAFGIFANNRWVFMVFSTIAIIAMIYFLFAQKNQHILFVISLSLLVGGGIGNMIDRIAKGYVVDFFKFLFVKFAVFNVADCFVTIGAFLLAVYLLFYFDDAVEDIKKSTLSEKNSLTENESKTDESLTMQEGESETNE